MNTTKRTKAAQKQRSKIAETFARMQRDDITPSEILGIDTTMPECLRRVRVHDVVRRFPHMGSEGSSKVLKKAKVWPLTRMGNLTDAEKDAILQHLPPRARK